MSVTEEVVGKRQTRERQERGAEIKGDEDRECAERKGSGGV
jgi:hypothetical protein